MSHIVDLMLHQVPVKGVSDLQLTNKRCRHNVFIAIICQSHVALEIMNVMLEALPGLYLDGDEVIAFFLNSHWDAN